MKLLSVPVLVAFLMLTGCGGGDERSSASATVTVTETVSASVSSSAAPSDLPSETSTASTAPPLAVGATAEVPWGTVTVLEIDSDVDTDPEVMAGLGDERWAGVRAESCVDSDYRDEKIKLSWSPWSVVDTENGVYDSMYDTTGPSWPEPVYPQLGDRTTVPGTCAQGWIVFDVTADADLARVVYESTTAPQPIIWKLK